MDMVEFLTQITALKSYCSKAHYTLHLGDFYLAPPFTDLQRQFGAGGKSPAEAYLGLWRLKSRAAVVAVVGDALSGRQGLSPSCCRLPRPSYRGRMTWAACSRLTPGVASRWLPVPVAVLPTSCSMALLGNGLVQGGDRRCASCDPVRPSNSFMCA